MASVRTRFPCASCEKVFTCAKEATSHFLSAYHKYNYYRKYSAKLSIVTPEEYEERLKEHQREEEIKNRKISVCCMICKKRYRTLKVYETHLQMSTHHQNVFNLKINLYFADNANEATLIGDYEEFDDEMENSIYAKKCLFCSHQSETLEMNLEHMDSAHSFYIPDQERCIDIPGLLRYLADKISEKRSCILCKDGEATFENADYARKHMMDNKHCMIEKKRQIRLEYLYFYSYPPIISDADRKIPVMGQISLPFSRKVYLKPNI